MGFFGELLFGSDSKKRAMSRLKNDYLTRYGDFASQIERSFDPILSRISANRAENISQYRADFERTMGDFQRTFQQARTDYTEGMDRAIGEYRTGREATIAMLRQTVSKQQQEAASRGAFSGLSATTFGQRRIESIGTQGALQESAIREEYARGLSGLEAQRAAGLSGMTMQYGGTMANLGAQMGSTTSNLMQQYNTQYTGMMMTQAQQAQAARGVGLAGYFGAAQARAALEGGDAARFGQMGMSLISAGLGSWAAGGFSNPFSAAPVNAGFNPNQLGVQGPFANT